jgi:P4 family phage/plasmid primase-like protien
MEPDIAQTIRFLGRLAVEGSLITVNSLTSPRDGNIATRQFSNIEDAAEWVFQESKKGHLTYFTCQEMRQVQEGRGRFSDVVALRLVPFEFDTGITKVRPATDTELAPALDAADKFSQYVEQNGFGRPTVIHSGSGGCYPLIIFKSPKTLDTNEERSRVYRLLRRFHQHMRSKFETDSVVADSMVDLPRILAIPGMLKNKKKGVESYSDDRPNRIVQVLEWGSPTPWEVFETFVSTLPEVEDETDQRDFSLSLVELPPDKLKMTGRAVDILAWGDVPKKMFKEDQSAAEYVVAVLLAGKKFSDDEIYTALTRFSGIRQPSDPKLHRVGYYAMTITKARAEFDREQKHLIDAIGELGLKSETFIEIDQVKSEPSTPVTPAGNAYVEELSTLVSKDIPFYNLTDLGNSERLVARFGKYIRFIYRWKKWIVFDGTRWVVDDGAYISKLAKATVRAIANETKNINIDDEKMTALLFGFAQKSESRSKIDSMTILAQTHAIDINRLDRDKMLLNVQNGTLDLHTGLLLPFNHENMITQMAGTRFDPEAKCPNFLSFLEKVMPDPILRKHLQMFVGYTLTGDTSERAFRIDWGQLARNGKSTLYRTLRSLFGDYGISVTFDTFGTRMEGKVRNDLASLVSKRLVIAVESGREFELDVNTVKSVTGNDEITARFLFREFFSFYPQFKIWLASNNKPVVKEGGNAIWDRMHLVEWTYRFNESEEIKDYAEMMLLPELPGILNWALEGCLEWQKESIIKPEMVLASIKDYRAEQWPLTDFILDCIEVDSNPNMAHEESFTNLYQAYNLWCGINDIRPYRQKSFAGYLREKFEYRLLRGRPVYLGLKLKAGTGI